MRAVTVILPADRHKTPHERGFAQAFTTESEHDDLAAAVTDALERLNLEGVEGRALIEVDWPHA